MSGYVIDVESFKELFATIDSERKMSSRKARAVYEEGGSVDAESFWDGKADALRYVTDLMEQMLMKSGHRIA